MAKQKVEEWWEDTVKDARSAREESVDSALSAALLGIPMSFQTFRGARSLRLGDSPATVTTVELPPKERALTAGKKMQEWAKQGISDARAGKFDPNTASGASQRYADWLAGGDFITGRISQAYQDSKRDPAVGKLVEAAVTLGTRAREKTVQYATDLSLWNQAVLHVDEGVKLLGENLGVALNWTADKVLKPLLIGAGVLGGVYLFLQFGLPRLMAKKGGIKSNPVTSYRTFIRSSKNWQEFGSARKHTVDRRLTYDEAKRACAAYNAERTPAQVRRGTYMEFEGE